MIKQELLDEIDRLYDKIADRDQTIEDLEKRVEELERGDVGWALKCPSGVIQGFDKHPSLLSEYIHKKGYRIIKVRVTEIPEEEG